MGEPALVDVEDPDYWQDPHRVLREARERHPVAFAPGGEAIVLRYADVERLASDHRNLSNALAFVEAMDPMPHEVHVLHVLEETDADPDPLAVAARDRMLALVPASLRDRVVIEVRFGKVGDEVLRMAEETEALFIVMAAHAKGFFSRMLSGDRAFEVLHDSPCPVWFVPVNWNPRIREEP